MKKKTTMVSGCFEADFFFKNSSFWCDAISGLETEKIWFYETINKSIKCLLI